MTKKERARLRSLMNSTISELTQSGQNVTTSYICEVMRDRYPEEVERSAAMLVNRSMADMARSLLKKSTKDDEMNAPSLFGRELDNLQIPRCIALPTGRPGQEIQWIPTMSATRAEIRAYAEYLTKGAQADLAKAERIMAFDAAVGRAADTDDMETPVSDLVPTAAAVAI